MAVATFSQFNSTEPCFLQFTPLLQRVSAAVQRTLASTTTTAEFQSVLQRNITVHELLRDTLVSETSVLQRSETSVLNASETPTSQKVDEETVQKVLTHFAHYKPDHTPQLVFRSTAQSTLSRLLDDSRGRSDTVLIVVSMGGSVFGCFNEEPWHYSSSFYGTGASEVFKVEDGVVKAFGRSKVNSFFRLSTETQLIVGGGNRHAIYLDAFLKHGASGECLTYKSPPLAELSEFECAVVEVWSFS